LNRLFIKKKKNCE